MAAQVIWLTTEPNAYPDRIRFTVEPEQDIRPWSEARLAWPLIVVAAIEAGAVTDPRHWWIGAGPILVGLDVGASV